MIDCIYIAASAHDARFTRICVASVRRFYPQTPVKLLVGGPLQPGLAEELGRYWNVGIAELPPGDYGWGFVKLEPLFYPAGTRFLVLDSDTVITGPILDLAAGRDEDFIVDDEHPSPERATQIYYDWAIASKPVGLRMPPPCFLFNTGQWFGRSGMLTRADFAGLIEWGLPPRLVHPTIFKNGDQGVLNLVLNEQYRSGRIRVARVPLMHWPGHGMRGLDAEKLASGAVPARVVHWAGMKKARQSEMIGADVLAYFEAEYYRRLPYGSVRKPYAAYKDMWANWFRTLRTRARLAVNRRLKRSQGTLA